MTSYRRDDAVLWRSTGRTVVLLTPAEDEPFSLGGAGVTLWDLLSGPHSTGAAAESLAAMFGISSADALEAITPVLEELTERGAVVVTEE
ncbi:MAG: PqqD family protein [Nocardioidaceae bacterium]